MSSKKDRRIKSLEEQEKILYKAGHDMFMAIGDYVIPKFLPGLSKDACPEELRPLRDAALSWADAGNEIREMQRSIR